MSLSIELPRGRLWLLGLAAVGLLLGLAGLGAFVTPATADGQPRLLTWDDWQAGKIRQAETAERGRLRAMCGALGRLLNEAPDAARAGLLLARARQYAAGGQPALETQRQAVLQAAQGVYAWAGGAATREGAAAIWQTAADALADQPDPVILEATDVRRP